jgi:hypothetical protein
MNGKKWRIFLRVLPLTALFCVVKVGMHFLGLEPWAFDSLTGSLFGAATFVVALTLSGTLADYGASERTPTEIANAIAAIQDSSALIAAGHPDFDPQPLRQHLARIIATILGWLQDGKPFNAIEHRSHNSHLYSHQC